MKSIMRTSAFGMISIFVIPFESHRWHLCHWGGKKQMADWDSNSASTLTTELSATRLDCDIYIQNSYAICWPVCV